MEAMTCFMRSCSALDRIQGTLCYVWSLINPYVFTPVKTHICKAPVMRRSHCACVEKHSPESQKFNTGIFLFRRNILAGRWPER